MRAVTISGGAPLSERLVLHWLGLLGLAQVADLVTTQVDLARGGVEANQAAAVLLAVGGVGLLWAVKLCLVAAMGLAVMVAWGPRWRGGEAPRPFVQQLVWRGIQGCVAVLAVTAAHNLAVLGLLTS